MKILAYIFILFLIVSDCPHVSGQEFFSDTVRLDLPTAERQFLSRNLALMAQKFTIEEHRANIHQAGVWDNPTLSIEQNIYNQETGKYFPLDRDGQTGFQIQQPFLLAGKHGKRVQLETTNTEIAEFNFYDAERTLKNELGTSFYELYYSQRLLGVYDKEIRQMRNTVQMFQAQYDKGNVSEKELVRLKAVLLSLENERKELYFRTVEIIQGISLLTGDTTHAYIVSLADTAAIDNFSLARYPLPALLDTALHRRSDLKSLEAATRAEEDNLSLQHALAIPDVKLGFMYDRNGSYIPEYKALTLEIDLPLFNRNQGSIEAAEYRVKSSRKQFEQYKMTVENEVRSTYLEAQENDHLYRSFDTRFATDFDTLIEGTVRNYEKGNMNVLEFTDFFESYKNTMVEFYKLASERIKTFEKLNLVTDTSLFGE